MCESVVCEHIPKTATARNKAINWNKGKYWAKKNTLFFSRRWVNKGTENRTFFWSRLISFFLLLNWVGVERILISRESNNSLPAARMVEYSRIMRAWIKIISSFCQPKSKRKYVWATMCTMLPTQFNLAFRAYAMGLDFCKRRGVLPFEIVPKAACRTSVPLQRLLVKFARTSTCPFVLFEVLPHKWRTCRWLVHCYNWLFFLSQVVLRMR